jgi:hypothetical protein
MDKEMQIPEPDTQETQEMPIPAVKPGPIGGGEEHVHGEHCEHEHGDPKEEGAQEFITEKDSKALVRSKYEAKHGKFPKAFLLQNKKSKALVELRGFTSVHACSMIGWRPRHVKCIAERVVELEPEEAVANE